jgi:hypothetical protein
MNREIFILTGGYPPSLHNDHQFLAIQRAVRRRRMDRSAPVALLRPSRIRFASDRLASSKDGRVDNTKTKAGVLLALQMPDDMQYHQQIHRPHSAI